MEVASSDAVEQWVLENHVDFAIVVGDPVAPQIVEEPFYKEDWYCSTTQTPHGEKEIGIGLSDLRNALVSAARWTGEDIY